VTGIEPGTPQLQVFDSDPIIPSFEAKRVLLSHQVDESHISGGKVCWPLAIAPPADSISPLSSSADSSLGHQSSIGHGRVNDLKFQLIVTIYRRGRLTRNVGFVVAVLCHDSFSYVLLRVQGEARNLLRTASIFLTTVIPRSDLSQPST
jgi:hypothetical protein